jgi:hypothetical protein
MLKHWLIELIGHTSGLSEAQLQQIEKALPRTRALINLLTKAQPIIEQAHSLYIEAEPLINQAMKEWQTVGPAAQIMIDVISHHVDKGGRRGLARWLRETIDAKTALEYGMVNEIHPRERLIERAYKLADHIMTQPRTTRRMTTQIVRRPWRRQITDSLDGGFAMQMFARLAKNTAAHGRSHIGDAVAYVRKGKRNNFD